MNANLSKKDIPRIIDVLNHPVNNLLIAKAFAITEKERVDRYIKVVFDDYNFFDKRTGERVTDPELLYLCDLGSREVKEYYEQCDKAHREHGFKGPKDHCPSLIAQDLERQAVKLLIDAAEPFFKISHDDLLCSGMKNFSKYVDALISLVVNHPNYVKAKIPA